LGDQGEESFDLTVCDPAWLSGRADADGVVDGRHLLVMNGFDWDVLLGYLSRRVEACKGSSWEEVGAQLARLGYWEFEDYSG